ncbi:MAG: cation diffusion facilitator family transporter [Bacilli bacterium]|nr:cation diffusion facilitator family transporter [Bacilli bacterium]MDD4733330.1 cation diffusion facilitator family transporter [Bacilli bacterium]
MNYITKTMLVSVITNIMLSIIKIVSGIIWNSTAIIADGIHSFSDLVTDFFAILGGFLARKPADEMHPYGHGKTEYLTSISISLIIMLLGFLIIYNSFNNEVVIPNILVSIVTVFTILTKLLLSSYVIKKGKEHNNSILIASGKESRVDVISSIVVLISSVLIQFSNNFPVFKYADLIATIIVGIFIVHVGFSILKDNISKTLDEKIDNNEYLEELKEVIKKHNEVITVESLIVIKYGYYYKLTATIEMESSISLKDAHNLVDQIERELKERDDKIIYINIHMEAK